MATNQNTKRKDKARVVLRKGESQRKDGKYDFRWTSPDGKRHSIYAATLEELRVSLPAAIVLSAMSALGACGASGVAGGSLL